MEDEYRQLLKDLRIPRYTSYPTAPHFNSAVDSAVVKGWYAGLKDTVEKLSLYVHIPFCEKLCLFCGCHTKVVNTYSPVQQYLSVVKGEISLIVKAVGHCPPISHLHFGGGSPTALTGKDFTDFMHVLKDSFPIDCSTDIAVEIDPRNVDAEKLDAYMQAGMNRISLGVQDFNEKVQKAINRIQPFALVKNVMDTLLSKGVRSINMDIMYGLPFQTVDTLKHTLDQVLVLNPDRLSVFGYAHVPWMKKHQNLIPEQALAASEERWEMYSVIKDILCANNYCAIGLDHFAKNTDSMAKALRAKTLNRNFQGYTTDTADALVGIGHSSIGYTPQGYMQNTTEPKVYGDSIKVGRLPIKRGFKTSGEDRLRARIIEDIMCYMRVDLEAVCDHFNTHMAFDKELSRLRQMVKSGIVSVEGNVITIPERGRFAIRFIASVFDTYLDTKQKRHSAAV